MRLFKMATKQSGISDEFRPIRKTTKRASSSDGKEYVYPYGSKVYIDNESGKKNVLRASEEDIEKNRFQNGIEVDEEDCPGPISTFEESNLQRDIIEALRHQNVLSPTPVQMQAIPILLSGRDLIAIAPTGSGKTFGYLLPMCAFLKSNVTEMLSPNNASSLIVVPTRELMQQILDSCETLLKGLNTSICDSEESNSFKSTATQTRTHSNMQAHITSHSPYNTHISPWNMPQISYSTYGAQSQNCYHQYHSSAKVNQYQNCAHSNQQSDTKGQISTKQKDERLEQRNYSVYGICGGMPIQPQLDRLKREIDVIVATPGRLLDLCQRNSINLENIKFIVLDECDKMLDMGLEDQLRKLMAMITSKEIPRQTSLWSATLPSSLERLARSSVVNPITLHVGLKDTVCQNIDQNVIFMHTYQKEKKLLQVLRQTKHPPVLVFVNSITTVDEVTSLLEKEQFFVERLHSKLIQDDRFKILSEFRNGMFDVLIATDIASRGLDIPDITHVINYDTPNTIEDYIHRCGRSGRFGRPGKATTFLTLECKIAEELKFLLESTGAAVPIALADSKQFGKKILKTELGDRVM